MIARNEQDRDVWKALADALPPSAINWRQQGKPASRGDKHYARFVAYIDSQFVQERFDSVVPGEWDSHLEMLPNVVTFDGEEDKEPYAFKCRIQVLGVIREDVGQGRDYKTAATDAFKRAAVRFGIGRELYAMEQNWVQMDGDGKYAKPIEDPSVAYARRYGRPKREPTANELAEIGRRSQPGDLQIRQDGSDRDVKPVIDGQKDYGAVPERERGEQASVTGEISHSASPSDEPTCPKCEGRMWDNRLTKRNPKAPDFKCRDRSCDGVIWPPKPSNGARPEEPEEVPF